MGILLVAVTVLAVLGTVALAVWLIGPEYDRHPLVRHVINAFARTVPGYIPPANLPKSYTDQVPGGWDNL